MRQLTPHIIIKLDPDSQKIKNTLIPQSDLLVINCLDSELICGPVWTDSDGREVQLLQFDSVDGAGAGVIVPVPGGHSLSLSNISGIK